MGLSPGARLGVYEIGSPLGAGGMGEVYRAHDTKLGRDVALKILPISFTNDPERVARFRREAQVLASLNHPHIAQIYGLEEANGTQFLVLELVDGESLDKRIGRGPIPVDEALGIAKEIAEALEAAHEKGIIHRDLKPANIALTEDGNVKVLDFGLAKAIEATSGPLDAMNSPTITSPAMMTGVGVILGTAAYMAPEQARGKTVDKRSDIWAFGCVLYEMVTGTRAFPGDDVTDTIVAVIRKEPDWSELPPATAVVRPLLARCLKKDPKTRMRDIGEARLQIDDLITGSRDATVVPGEAADTATSSRRVSPWAAAALAVGAFAVAAFQPCPARVAAVRDDRRRTRTSDLFSRNSDRLHRRTRRWRRGTPWRPTRGASGQRTRRDAVARHHYGTFSVPIAGRQVDRIFGEQHRTTESVDHGRTANHPVQHWEASPRGELGP